MVISARYVGMKTIAKGESHFHIGAPSANMMNIILPIIRSAV
jgi:hypothetical protein